MANLYPSLLNLWQDFTPDNQHQTTSFISMPDSTKGPIRNQVEFISSQSSDFSYPSLDLDQPGAIKSVKVAKSFDGKIGLRLESFQGGFFVVLTDKGSPASLADINFGDQILKVDDISVNGFSLGKLLDLIQRSSSECVSLLIRTRPLATRVTLDKDHYDCIGLKYDNRGKITGIIKNSSAALNGVLVDQNIIGINSHNAIGLSKSELRELIHSCGYKVTLTLMQSKIYEKMTKGTNPQIIRENFARTPLTIW